MNGCAPGFALIERLKATRKWAIGNKPGSVSSSLDHHWLFIPYHYYSWVFILNQRLFSRFLPLENNYQFSTLQ